MHLLSSEIIKSHQNYFTIMLLMLVYKHLKEILNTVSSWLQYTHITRNTPDYWPMAREYSIWNAAVAALNFWTADLKAHTLSSATEESLQNILLCTISTYTPSDIWWNIFWSLCDHAKCCIWTKISIRRWRLWKQFRKCQHTYST